MGTGTAPAYLLTIVVSGLAFGLVYEFTQNLYFVAFLHGFGNIWPLVVEWGSWTLWTLVTYVAVVPIVLGYRYWMARTGHTPVVLRKEAPLKPGRGHAGRS